MSSAYAACPGAIPGRIIGGRELPTSPLSTDSDGSPYADQKHTVSSQTATAHSSNDSNESYGKQAPAGEITTDDLLERPATEPVTEASRTSTV